MLCFVCIYYEISSSHKSMHPSLSPPVVHCFVSFLHPLSHTCGLAMICLLHRYTGEKKKKNECFLLEQVDMTDKLHSVNGLHKFLSLGKLSRIIKLMELIKLVNRLKVRLINRVNPESERKLQDSLSVA